MPDGGSLGVTGSESDGIVEITMEDSGVGIDPAVAERLLEPFFTCLLYTSPSPRD